MVRHALHLKLLPGTGTLRHALRPELLLVSTTLADTVCNILRSQSCCWALQPRVLPVAACVCGRARSLCVL